MPYLNNDQDEEKRMFSLPPLRSIAVRRKMRVKTTTENNRPPHSGHMIAVKMQFMSASYSIRFGDFWRDLAWLSRGRRYARMVVGKSVLTVLSTHRDLHEAGCYFERGVEIGEINVLRK